jgi:hypothetical protein
VPHLVSYTMGNWSFMGVKRPGRGVNHPTLSSAGFKEGIELSLHPVCSLITSYRATRTWTCAVCTVEVSRRLVLTLKCGFKVPVIFLRPGPASLQLSPLILRAHSTSASCHNTQPNSCVTFSVMFWVSLSRLQPWLKRATLLCIVCCHDTYELCTCVLIYKT